MFQKSAVKIFALTLVSSFALAGQYGVQSISDISSLQLRADGQYNVVCKSGDFEVVSSADVAANNVCPYLPPPPPPPPVEIMEGTYRDPSGALCDQKLHASYSGQTLQAIRLDFPGCNGEFLEAACVGNVCSGTTFGWNIVVQVTDINHYDWTPGTNPTVHFQRIGDLSIKSPKRSQQSHSNEPGR